MGDMDLLAKLLAAKGGHDDMDPDAKMAKMKVLAALKDEMGKMIGGDLGSLKKVTVAAPDEQGLQEGLAKAKDLIGQGVNVDDDSNPDTQDDDSDEDMLSDGGLADDHEHEADDIMDGAADAPGAEDDVAGGLDHLSPEELKALVMQLRAGK